MRFTRENVNRLFKITIVGIVIVALAMIFMAEPGAAEQAHDHGALGNNLDEIGAITNITDNQANWGGGISGFSSSNNGDDVMENNTLDNWAGSNDILPGNFTMTMTLSIDKSALLNAASPGAIGNCGFRSGAGNEVCWFAWHFIEPVSGELNLRLAHDNCSSNVDSNNIGPDLSDGLQHWAVTYDNTQSGSWDYEFFINGTSVGTGSSSQDPCTDITQYGNSFWNFGCQEPSQNGRCDSGDHFEQGEIYDARWFNETLTNSEISQLAEAGGSAELGSEDNLWTFGDNVTESILPEDRVFVSQDASTSGFTDLSDLKAQPTTGTASIWTRDRGNEHVGGSDGNRIIKLGVNLAELENRAICTGQGEWEASSTYSGSFGLAVTPDGFPMIPCDWESGEDQRMHLLQSDGSWEIDGLFGVIRSDNGVGAMPADALSGNKIVADGGDSPEKWCQYDFVSSAKDCVDMDIHDTAVSRSGNDWVAATGPGGTSIRNSLGGPRVVPDAGVVGRDVEIHGERLFLYDEQNTQLEQWDIDPANNITLNQTDFVNAQSTGANRFDLSPDGQIIAGITSSQVHVWDAREGQTLEKMATGNLSVSSPESTAIHPTNDFVYVSNDTTVERFPLDGVVPDAQSFTEEETTGSIIEDDTTDSEIPEGEEGTGPFSVDRVSGMSQNQTNGLMATFAILIFSIAAWGMTQSAKVSFMFGGVGFIFANVVGWVPVWFTILFVIVMTGAMVFVGEERLAGMSSVIRRGGGE